MSWGFEEDDEHVDLERIYDELQGRVAIEVFAYLGALKQNAPRVYDRLGQWAQERGVMGYVAWSSAPNPKPSL